MEPKKIKNSVVLANLLITAEDRPLSKLELRTFKVLMERSSIEEIERSINLTKKSSENPSLRGQLLRDKPKMLRPRDSKIRRPQRKRGYTDKGNQADENSVVRKKILNESLVYLPDLEHAFPFLTKKLIEFSRGFWFSIGDWEDFVVFLWENDGERISDSRIGDFGSRERTVGVPQEASVQIL